MGKLKGYRMVTLYVEPLLYEKVRCAAYLFDQLIYLFVEEALASAIERRLDKVQKGVIGEMAKQNVAKGSKRRSRHNSVL